MKQSEVKIGSVYQVKVSGVLKAVRVEGQDTSLALAKRRTRYYGTVLSSGRKIRLTAARMRKELITMKNALDPDYAEKVMKEI